MVLTAYPELIGGQPAFARQTGDPISIPAGSQLTVSNVLQTRFGLNNVKGSLFVYSTGGEPLVISSRTYTSDADGGTYGQDVSSVQLVGTGWASGLRHDGFYRTTVGIFWPWEDATRFTLTVHDASGDEVGGGVLDFDRAGLRQVNLSDLGVSTLIDGYLRITADDAAAPWYGYASRVDQISGDGVFRILRGYQPF